MPLSGDQSQLPQLCRGNKGAPQQSGLSQGGEPLCIPNIGLATGDLFDVPGVHDLCLDPHLFQGRIGTFPVDPGALHDHNHRIGPMGGTPQGQCLPVLLKSTKLSALDRNVSVRVRENGTGGDLGLMNIQADNPVKEGLQFHNDVSPITIKGRWRMPVPKSPACGKPQAALLMCALKGGNPGYESAWRVTLDSGWNHQKLARPQSAISSPPILFHPLGWRESQCALGWDNGLMRITTSLPEFQRAVPDDAAWVDF